MHPFGSRTTNDAPVGPGNAQTARSRVLSIENDAHLGSTISTYLEAQGFDVTRASTGAQAMDRIKRSQIALVLLALRLGPEDGLGLLRELRRGSDVPIIIVAEDACDEIDRVVALELGADDSIAKPFSLRELLARINAVLRRAGAVRKRRETAAVCASRYRFAGWTFDTRTRRLSDPAGRLVPLTKGEFALLSSLVAAPQRPLTREVLLRATRLHEDIHDRSIDVQILRLRRKLETDPRAPGIILTERGVGYRFAAAVVVDKRDSHDPGRGRKTIKRSLASPARMDDAAASW